MIINLMYISAILIGCYFAVSTYIRIKNTIILWGFGILIFSLCLEIRRLNVGNYITVTTDIFRKIGDILRTLLTVLLFRKVYVIEDQKKGKEVLINVEKELGRKGKNLKLKLEQNRTELDQINTELEQIETEKEEQKIREEQNEKPII